MGGKKWTKVWVQLVVIVFVIVGGFNYVIDPYGIYKTSYFNFEKIKQSEKIQLIKAIKVKEIKPRSIVLGNSRTEFGYDPRHDYFEKPSYNFGTSGSSMYEVGLNFQWALAQGNLKQVLLVVDYRMFNSKAMKSLKDFESNFDDKSIYSYLFSMDTLKDSVLTARGAGELQVFYLENGQREHTINWKSIVKDGGHLEAMNKYESLYYEGYPTNYRYKDTGKNSFSDFEEIIKLCYENNILVDIVFGPSHIRQWESLNYFLGFDKWLKWKKDIVLSVDKISKQYKKKQYRIFDFSVYHELTAEEVPKDKNVMMKYHWEGIHYKHELGVIVLDRLKGLKVFEDFGTPVDLSNIDLHLQQQMIKRSQFIDIEEYQKSVFTKLIGDNRGIR